MISANELRKVQLSSGENGYDTQQVNAVIEEAAKTIDAYVNENKELYRKMEILAKKIEEYREEEDSIKAALITAEKMAEQIRRESNEKASALILESEKTAKNNITEAQEKADKVIAEAREYASSVIKEKNEQASEIMANAEKKANDAINGSKIVAQNILDQAKEISDDLVSKSKDEKEAYENLVTALKSDAEAFISNLKALYSNQLSVLEQAKLESDSPEAAEKKENINSLQNEVDSLIGEMKEMENAIPDNISFDEPEYSEVKAPELEDIAKQEEPVKEIQQTENDIIPEDAEFEEIEDTEDSEVAEDTEDTLTEDSQVEEAAAPVEEIVIDEKNNDADDWYEFRQSMKNNDIISDYKEEKEEEDPMVAIDDIIGNIQDSGDDTGTQDKTDPMEAVKAFSTDEITPIDKSFAAVNEISDDAELEKVDGDDESLFDSQNQLPFESYFNIKREDSHTDRTQTISLVPPEEEEEDEDDQPKFRGFFKKKK